VASAGTAAELTRRAQNLVPIRLIASPASLWGALKIFRSRRVQCADQSNFRRHKLQPRGRSMPERPARDGCACSAACSRKRSRRAWSVRESTSCPS